MKTLWSYMPLVLGALIEEGSTFHGVHSFHSPVSFHCRHAIQHGASSVTLPMAKSKTATKKKKGISVSSLQGFGSPTSTATLTTSGGIIDRSKSALLFYDILKATRGGSNLKQVGLGQVPLPGTNCSIRGVIALQDILKEITSSKYLTKWHWILGDKMTIQHCQWHRLYNCIVNGKV
ncbi:hypothetical protein HJC23_012511 [Cyclotella cryptica]|uniref:Uncharacterized protein n=1 Tax=Cyclotella cryptica TaxID=29204 RepID=A0ABD3QQX5_9STRA|eukprot:CCRYP_003122-RA/>CCRYP_003122-RA protein AED:0.35 eAED:0.35 QI:0/-1/0/1/-1/1/1/0/176